MSAKQKKISSYVIHKLLQDKGKFYCLHKRVKYSKFREHYGISKTNRCVGFTPDYVGQSVSKIVSAKNYFIEFIVNNFDKIKSSVSASCFIDMLNSANEERVVFSQGFTTCADHLKQYFKDNSTDDEWTVESIMNVLNYNKFNWFKSSKVSFYNGDEIYTTIKTNGDAYPGHYSNMLFGPRKYLSDRASRSIAHKIWKTLEVTPQKNFYLWTILGRSKDIKIDLHATKEVGTRVVMSCENPATTLLLWFAQKMSKLVTDNEVYDTKFNINGDFNNKKYSKLINKESNYDYILEADWSYYDSNIDTNFLIVAGLLICSGLPDDRLHNNIRHYIISSIVCKYVIIPPGVVVELNRAQPSGHPFGTMVNCYVNLIYWSLIGYKIYGENYSEMMDIEVYGDDTRAYFKYHKNLHKLDQYVSECGLRSDILLGNFRSVNEYCDKEHQIDFLKRRFDDCGITWNHKKMFDKLFYQSKNRNINDQYLMTTSWYETVPTDKDCFIINKLFGEYLKTNYYDEINSDNKLIIDSYSRRDFGENKRMDEDFEYYNGQRRDDYNYSRNIDYDKRKFIYNEKYIIEGNYNKRLTYEENRLLLSFMAIAQTKLITKREFRIITDSRDPPSQNNYYSDISRFERILEVKSNLLKNLVKKFIMNN